MLKRAGLVQACLLGAALNATALFAGTAFAQQGCCEGGDATGANAWTEGNATSAQWPPNPPPPANIVTLPVKAPPPAPVPYWWTHGEIEFGGRGFVNNPDQSGSIWGDTNPANTTTGGYTYLGQKSLGKFYEYGIENPNPFGGGHVAAGTSDGLYQVDLWANNIASNFDGFSDQAYLLQASKVGEHYFWFSWDQTPHIYSTSAQTIWQGVGSDNLTLPAGLVANPLSHAPSATVIQNCLTAACTASANGGGILPYLYGIDLGIKRDTASAGYRWTPPDPTRPEGYAWDLRTDYSYMTRKGTQAAGILEFNGFQPTQVPAPVDDSTQNFGASGEYAGTAWWGGKYTFKMAYNGSVYNDNMSSYSVQNPFFPTATTNPAVFGHCTAPSAGAAGTANCGSALMSTPPSNSANGGSVTATAELPWSSRYAGTFSYVRMEQNDSFIPMTNNPFAVTSPFGPNWNQVNFGFINGNLANPTSSLNGQINEILSNNVLTTKITPELTQKLTYRYYDFDNETPRIIFPEWISYDGTGSTGGTVHENTISSLTISYIKQDAGYELNWRPSSEWNFNAAGGWERYDYTQTDVNVTNEFSGKASVDWKPTVWLTARASGYYADRRYDTYDYDLFVKSIQFPTITGFTPTTSTSWFYAPAYQQFMFDNRERTKVNLALDVVAFRGVTISPTFKYQDDFYGLNPANQEGITDSKITSWGVDVGWVVTPDLSFAASYYWEKYDQSLYNYTNTFAPLYEAQPGTCTPPFTATNPNANCLLITSDKQHVNTVTAAMNYAAIPGKLDFDLRYTMSWGVDEQKLLTSPNMPASACSNCVGVFPNDTTLFERLDATATYKFDPIWVRSMGFNGDLKAKLRYTWERNGVNNWQNDPLAPFTNITGLTNAIWLAYQNPNYNVQMIAGSLIASW
jgi:MtrB/PioB family decaheme-associated outer membrane protein